MIVDASLKNINSSKADVSYTSARQFALDTFQALNSHMWLVATVLDGTMLEASNFYNVMPLICGLRL